MDKARESGVRIIESGRDCLVNSGFLQRKGRAFNRRGREGRKENLKALSKGKLRRVEGMA